MINSNIPPLSMYPTPEELQFRLPDRMIVDISRQVLAVKDFNNNPYNPFTVDYTTLINDFLVFMKNGGTGLQETLSIIYKELGDHLKRFQQMYPQAVSDCKEVVSNLLVNFNLNMSTAIASYLGTTNQYYIYNLVGWSALNPILEFSFYDADYNGDGIKYIYDK